MIGRGVPAGTRTPFHEVASKRGTPASAIVGTSGITAERFALLTASARILPERTCGDTARMVP